jgi:hypothetical protein
MANRNCPNCAAPYDTTLNKCPYCGTSYFDMSCIDINNKEPFYLKLRTGNFTFVSKVMVGADCCITFSTDATQAINVYGQSLSSIITKHRTDIDLHFESVD